MNAAGDSSDSTAVETARANSPEPAPESLTPGELLRRERERRSITALHIAEELHLDARIVAAIEDNRFEELGPSVYARGHLRQYAALLGLSPQFIIERYEAVTGQREVPVHIPAPGVVAGPVDFERRSLAGPLWSAVGLVALLMGWWIWSTVSTHDPMQSATPDEAVTQSGDLPSALPAEPGEPDAQSPPTVSNAVPAAAAPVAAPATVAETADIRMRLEFNDASWTEIYDANGKRLMFGMGESGKVSTVSGPPPLRVTLGKASAVTVQVNDRQIVVPRRAGKDAAKFVVVPGGTVQMASGEVPVE
jgi:cytoskeleton protein RodZ